MRTRRTALVTGASRGIGAAVARELAGAGCRVAVHYVKSGKMALAVREGLAGDGHLVVQADLQDPVQVEAMVGQVARDFGTIDVLVNNAGVFFDHPVEAVDYAEWQRAWDETLKVNLIGPANLIWCCVRHMGEGGRIVNVGSRGAFRGEPRCPAYGASKAAIASLGQSLAKALGSRGIAVTTLAPGFVDTDMAADAMAGEEGAVRRAESPFNRIATAEEVARAVAYLASPDAEWASGAILDFNGASYLRM